MGGAPFLGGGKQGNGGRIGHFGAGHRKAQEGCLTCNIFQRALRIIKATAQRGRTATENSRQDRQEARKERQEQHLGVLSVHLGDLGGRLSSRDGKGSKISSTETLRRVSLWIHSVPVAWRRVVTKRAERVGAEGIVSNAGLF